jgi:hypothetical protein
VTLTDEILQILREKAVPMSRNEIFKLASEAGDADDVSRALYHLNKSGKIKRTSADLGGYQWEIPIGEQLKAALKPKRTPAPKPILPPSAKPMPTGKLGYSIHDGGALTIYLNDGMSDPLELDADETLALGDFLHQTQGLWRP